MQMQENVYVNQDKSRDENQNTNFSSFAEKRFNAIPQEGDYTEITEIEERYPIRLRKGKFLPCLMQCRGKYPISNTFLRLSTQRFSDYELKQPFKFEQIFSNSIIA